MSKSLPIARVSVDSRALKSVGHGMGVLEVEFHAPGCAKLADKGKACLCSGGRVVQYPDVTPEEHAALMAADSIGKHFVTNFKNRKTIKGDNNV